MCSKTNCKQCGKATWSGCGNHIEQALAGVPQNQRCTCREDGTLTNASRGGLLARLFGKK
jgi:hypothetical protein